MSFEFFLTKHYGNILTGTPIMRASNAECRWGRQKSRFTTDIWLHRVMSTLRPPSHTAAPDRGKLVTLIDGKRRRLLFARDSRRSVYDKKHQRYAEDN